MQASQMIQQVGSAIHLFFVPWRGLNLPALRQIIPQLAHQNRWHPHTVVIYISGDVADVEFFPRREHCFKEQVPVVFPTGTISRAEKTLRGHQIKIHGGCAAGVFPIVHTQQTDHFKRNGPHGHQGAEIDHAHQETLGHVLIFEGAQHSVSEHRNAQGFFQTRIHAVFSPCGGDIDQKLPDELIVAVGGQEEII